MKHCGVRCALAILLLLLISPSIGWQGDRVRLKDVQILTLRQGQYTSGRRSHPVPQLNCLGGSAGCRDAPSVVQCYNRGSDGRDVQWECKAEMKRTQKFGLLQVSCEGYDYPEDDFILVGSCGLEYYLEKTGYDRDPQRKPLSDRRRPRETYPLKNYRRVTPERGTPGWKYPTKVSWPVVHQKAAPGSEYPPKIAKRQADERVRYWHPEHHHQRSEGMHSSLLSKFIIWIAFLISVVFLFCLCCAAFGHNGAGISYQRVHPCREPQPEYIAPPPYNPTFNPYQYASGYGCTPGFGWAHNSGGGPGFWTGAASGGLMGYLFGSRNQTSERTVCASPEERAFPTALPPASPFYDEPDDEYFSTGFGGTDRR